MSFFACILDSIYIWLLKNKLYLFLHGEQIR